MMTILLPKERGHNTLKGPKSSSLKPIFESKQKSELPPPTQFRTGKPCPSKVKGKDEFAALWNEAKKIMVPTFEVWTEVDEQALVELEETVELEGTIVLGRRILTIQLARKPQHWYMASVADMSAKQIAALEQMIAATKGRQFLPGTCLFSWLAALYVSKHFLGCQRRMISILTSFVPWELAETLMRLMVCCCVDFAQHDKS
eukprot:scaffold26224_cov63-Attheya_sp.AAC.2